MCKNLFILIWVALQIFGSIVYAEGLKKLEFQKFDEDIPQRPISDLMIDHKGFLWIATYGGGIHRFDGAKYESYTNEWKDSKTLNNNFVLCLHEDRNHQLWIGTESGLNQFNSANFSFVDIPLDYLGKESPQKPSIQAIYEIKNDQLLLGIYRYGLNIFNTKTMKSRMVQNKTGLDNFNIYEIIEMNKENYGLATNQGLLIYNLSLNAVIKPELDKNSSYAYNWSFESIFKDSRNNIWIGTMEHGIIQIEDFKAYNQLLSYRHFPISNMRITDIVESNSGEMIFSTENDGIIVFDPTSGNYVKQVHNTFNPISIESNSIWSMHYDNFNRLWVGYYNNGIGLNDPAFSKFKNTQNVPINNNSLKSTSINSIVQQNDNVLWFGMDGGGIDKYLIKEDEYIHVNSVDQQTYQGLTNESVQSIFLDSRNNLWVGCWEGGIFLLKNGEKKFKHLDKISTNGGLKSNRVTGFDEDIQGRVWIATFSGGLHYFDPKLNRIIHCNGAEFKGHMINDSDIRDLLVDKNQNIWIGTTNGLFKHNDKNGLTNIKSYKQDAFSTKFHPSFNYILTLYEDNNHNIWFGTDGAGLFCLNPENDVITEYNTSLGFNQKTVCGITQDHEGNIWSTGKSGISVINLINKQITNYGKEDGLLSNNFNYNSILTCNSGKIYFGNNLGLNFLNPKQLQNNTEEVKVYLNNLRLFNKIVYPNQENSPLKNDLNSTLSIELNHKQSIFSIDYTGINFTHADKIQFAYYLEGLEDDWNYVGHQRSATYTSLNNGNYTFKLKAANNDGIWSEDSVTLNIKVLPPWYKSDWAYFIFIVLLVISVYGIVRLRTSYLHMHRARLKNLVKLRTQELIQKNERISMQAEELNVFNDALKDLNENLEKTVQERTNELIIKNNKLAEYAFINAHNLRVPVANIKGIIQLFEIDRTKDEILELIELLKGQSNDLDRVLFDIKYMLEKDELLFDNEKKNFN